jgi:LAO/AO transport system kinase
MQRHAGDAGVYVRSMATRGSLGGLARATSDVALLLDAAGRQIILIETVGVGQDEVEIARLADCTLVLVVPGLGDDVQNMKAGLMEIADILVLNKSDREGADALEQQLAAAIQLSPGDWQPPVVRTTAPTGDGVPELAAAIEHFRAHLDASGRWRAQTLAQWERRLLLLAEDEILRRFTLDPAARSTLDALVSEVAAREKDPYTAVRELLSHAGAETQISPSRGQQK